MRSRRSHQAASHTQEGARLRPAAKAATAAASPGATCRDTVRGEKPSAAALAGSPGSRTSVLAAVPRRSQ